MSQGNNHLSAFDRSVLQAVGDNRSFGRADDPAATEFPLLWKWLSTSQLKGNYVKTPATITIRLSVDGVQVVLADRDLAVSVEACCADLANVFQALEAALNADTPPLKTWGKREPNLRKRKRP